MEIGSGCNGMELVVVEFTTLITLKGFEGCVKLCLNTFVEIFNFDKCFRFEFEGKNPCEVGEVIDYDEVIFKTSIAWDGRSPQVSVMR